MKRNTVVTIGLLLVVLFGTTVAAHARPPVGSPWSEPVEIVRNEGENWISNPRLLADEALWATWNEYPGIGVGHFDGGTWHTRSFLYDPTGQIEDEWFSGTQPLLVTDGDSCTEKVFHIASVGYRDNGTAADFYTGHTRYNGDFVGGGYYVTPLDFSKAGNRFVAVVDEVNIHVVWRHADPNDANVYYAQGERFRHGWYNWTTPVTVTTEFNQGTTPAIWAEGEFVVLIVDDTTEGVTWSFTSLDGGTTWTKHIIGSGLAPSVVESRDSLFVLLNDEGALQLYKSDDLGYMWMEYSNILVPTTTEDHRLVSQTDGYMAAVWTDDHTIFAATSFDGVDWRTEEVFSSDGAAKVHPDVSFWKNKIFVTWQSGQSILISNRPVRYQVLLPIVTKSG